MKNLLTTLLAVFLITIIFLPRQASAQSPQAFKYQAVVRNNTGEIISNQAVSFRISIRTGSALGYIVYQETHSVTTNDFGLANLEVGNGVTSDDFSSIDWTSGPKYLETELDPANGSSYVSMGTTQLLSVPFAMYAETARTKELTDDDNNTRITAEENPNEDTLRFFVAGNQVMKHDGKTLHLTDPNNNVYIGNNVGSSNTSGSLNVAMGSDALKSNQAGNGNIAVGSKALFKNDIGFGNTAIGSQAGYQNISGDNNVFIGKFAGYNETGNNKLYIENTQAPPEQSLIYGDFDANIITMNANIGIGKINPEAALDIIGDIGISSSPAMDQSACGITSIEMIDQNDVGPGAALCLNSNGSYTPATASDYSKLPCVALAVEDGTGLHKVLHLGYFRADSWNWNVPGLIFVDGSDGNLTQAEHLGYNDINQIVGYATNTNTMFFNPDPKLYYKNNLAPVPFFELSPYPIQISEDITFDASNSYDPDVGDYIILYEWDWDGNGNFEESTANPIVIHQFSEAGLHHVSLRVTDNNFLSEEATQIIEVDCEQNGFSCGYYYSLGTVCGDSGNENLSIQNCGNDWFRIYLEECNFIMGEVDLNMQIALQSPSGVNYDLYVYDDNCNLIDSSINPTEPDTIALTIHDNFLPPQDDSQYFRVEVRMISGISNSYWTLDVNGNTL